MLVDFRLKIRPFWDSDLENRYSNFSGKQRLPGKASFYHFSPEKLTLLPLVKEVTPSSDRKTIKRLTFDNLFPPLRHSLKLLAEWRCIPRFPAKMTLAHARTLLRIEKISYSLSYSSKLSNSLHEDCHHMTRPAAQTPPFPRERPAACVGNMSTS